MKRKKTAQIAPDQKSSVPAPQPVMQGNTFVAFIREASSLGNEVEARRAFDTEVGVYLKEKSLIEDFEGWRAARAKPPAAT